MWVCVPFVECLPWPDMPLSGGPSEQSLCLWALWPPKSDVVASISKCHHPLSLGPPGLPERDNGQPVPGKRQATKSNSSANAVQFRPFPHPRVLKPETRKMGPFRACCQPILCRWLEIDLPLIIGMLGEHNRAGLCYVAAVCSVLCSCWGSCSQNYYRI